MSSPLPFTNPFAPSGDWQPDGTVSLKPSAALSAGDFSPASLNRALADFKYTGEDRDRKPLDYLLLGLLSIAIHTGVVQRFDGAALDQEIIEPAKPLPKVQITLSRPQPKPVAAATAGRETQTAVAKPKVAPLKKVVP